MAQFPFSIPAQPTDTTCGPTCLHAVYAHFGDSIDLKQVIAETREVPEGGTLDAFLAVHALRRGYKATIYTHNLKVFDPTWFALPMSGIREKLLEQLALKDAWKLDVATHGYVDFIDAGGKLRMEDLTGKLLRRFLKRNVPILTGLSSTWLYRCAREMQDHSCEDDDLRGEPTGHFVVVHGYHRDSRTVDIADPHRQNPMGDGSAYRVSIEHLIASVLVGVTSFDCNLLVIEPPAGQKTTTSQLVGAEL